jgi:hypothetical protein
VLRGILLLAVLGCAACKAPRGAESADGCRLRVIVALDRAPDSALLEDLSRASGARLELTSDMPAGLYLMELAADEAGDACSRALERLRQDERVRSADIDERRGIAD